MTFWDALAWFILVVGLFRVIVLLYRLDYWMSQAGGSWAAKYALENSYYPRVLRALVAVIIASLWLIFG